MAHQVVLAVCAVLGFISHHVSAQWFGGGLQAGQGQLGGWGGAPAAGFGVSPSPLANMFGQQQDNTRYLTCIAANSNNDDMRITFTTGNDNNNNPWGRFGLMGNRFANAGSLRLEARITSGMTSQLQGQFQLVVTEFSRSEEVCLSRALGDILTDRTPAWWGRGNQRPRGIVGTPIRIMQGQTATSSESIENLQFDELAGRGMALCPAHQISGTTCVDAIPLCCKIGYDTQRATTPFTPVGQMFQQPGAFDMQNGGFGNTNNGLGGGLNQGFGSPGFGQGMNQGMNGQAMGGMDQGLSPQGFGGMGQGNGSPRNQGGIAFRR